MATCIDWAVKGQLTEGLHDFLEVLVAHHLPAAIVVCRHLDLSVCVCVYLETDVYFEVGFTN